MFTSVQKIKGNLDCHNFKNTTKVMEYASVTQESYYPASKKARKAPKTVKRVYKKRSPAFDAKVRAAMLRQIETKHRARIETEQTTTTIAPSPIIDDFPENIGIGTNSYNRIGNKVTGTGIKMSMILHNNATGIGKTMLVRVAILKVLRGNSYTNTDIETDLFDPLSSGGDVTYSGGLPSLIRRFNSEELKVLYDKVHSLAANNDENTNNTQIVKFYKRLNEEWVYTDGDQTHPSNCRYVMILWPLLSNSDESLGETLEYSFVLDCYYKEK